jgi:aryl-alcohol dehydrogenase-like predicted oxidoreductase
MTQSLSLDSYRLLGRSGLRVSPLCLGAMTFGKEYEWGADTAEARRMFDTYVGRGGNFIDTANIYTNGTSERLVGQFAAAKRHSLVIATKYSMTVTPNDPNSSGNHRKNMMRSVEASLERLNTDYIDLLYLHGWDDRTPVEEIMRGMDDLVRAGKVTYVAISNTPAWQVARMQTIADLRGWSPLIAFQLEYSLVERTVERDMIPMARELGLGVMPWSPLGGGVLTGKYSRADLAGDANKDIGSRKALALMIGTLSERNLVIVDAVREIAEETGKTTAQVALAWTLLNPAVTAPIMGVRTLAQLEDNLGALDVQLSSEQCARLNEVSAIDLGNPHDLLAGPYQQMLLLGTHPVAKRK